MAGKLILSPRTPFAYHPGATVLHRAPAGVKFLCVIVVSAVCFVSVYALAASIVLIAAASIAARIPPRQLLKGSKPLVILSLFIVLLKTFLPLEGDIFHIEGLVEGLIIAMRIFVPYAAAALLFAVTTMRQLRYSMKKVFETVPKCQIMEQQPQKNAVLQAIGRKIAKACDKITNFGTSVSLGICLMLGFIPRFFELWEASNMACEARSCKRGLRRLLLLIPLVTERMMETASDTAMALQARALGSSREYGV